MAKRKLLSIQSEVSHTLSDLLRTLEKQTLENLQLLIEAEILHARQLSKLTWLKEGDINTKFFQAAYSVRKAKASISNIFDSQGKKKTDPGDIAQEFISYFSNLFGVSVPYDDFDEAAMRYGPKLFPAEADLLVSLILEEEIKRAVWNMDSNSRMLDEEKTLEVPQCYCYSLSPKNS